MNQDPIDPQQENRRLRAAAETMRSKQRMAQGGVVGILLATGFYFKMDVLPLLIRYILLGAAASFAVVAFIPFLRSRCPKCRADYHSLASLARSPENPPSCKSCGFQINSHISRY